MFESETCCRPVDRVHSLCCGHGADKCLGGESVSGGGALVRLYTRRLSCTGTAPVWYGPKQKLLLRAAVRPLYEGARMLIFMGYFPLIDVEMFYGRDDVPSCRVQLIRAAKFSTSEIREWNLGAYVSEVTNRS